VLDEISPGGIVLIPQRRVKILAAAVTALALAGSAHDPILCHILLLIVQLGCWQACSRAQQRRHCIAATVHVQERSALSRRREIPGVCSSPERWQSVKSRRERLESRGRSFPVQVIDRLEQCDVGPERREFPKQQDPLAIPR